MSNNLFAVYLILGAIALFWYVIIPILVAATSRIAVEPDVEFIDWTNYPIPEALQVRLDHDSLQLQTAGFQPLAAYILHGFGASTEHVRYLYINRETSRIAAVGAILIVSAQNRTLNFVETRLSGAYHSTPVHDLTVYSSPETGPFLDSEHTIRILLPHITEISQLIEVFDLAEQRHFAHAEKKIGLDTEFSGDISAWVKSGSKKYLKMACDSGFFTRRPNEDVYRMPLRSVYRSGWHIWWPMRLIHRQLLINRGRRLERDYRGN